MKRHLRLIILLGLVVALFIGAYFLSSPLKRSLADGYRFIRNSYSNFQYTDDYLTFRYPTENLDCPIDNCNLTYRLLDAYFDVLMLEQAGATPRELGDQLDDAQAVTTVIKPFWQRDSINNTLKSNGNEDFALDAYCIFGWLTSDQAMAESVIQYLSGFSWLAENYYTQDRWRNIADETWCIRLMIATDTGKDKLADIISRKISQTNSFIIEASAIDQQAVLYHMVYVLKEALDKGIGIEDLNNTFSLYTQQLWIVTQEDELLSNSLIVANTLEALISVKYDDQEGLKQLADKLISLQQKDGSWRPTPEATQGQVFASLRALLALEKYSNYIKSL